MLFSYRSGKSEPTLKALRKLEAAEKAAGIPKRVGLTRVSPLSNEAEEGNFVPHGTKLKGSDEPEPAKSSGSPNETEKGPEDLLAVLLRIAAALEKIAGNLEVSRADPPGDPNWFRPEAAENVVELRFFGDVAAGKPAGCLDFEDTISVPGGWDPESHFVVRVAGRSMEPDFPDGTRIVCRRLRDGEFAKKNDLVICQDGDGAYFKKLVYTKEGPKTDMPRKPRPHLVSLNPEFPEVVPVADLPIVAKFVDRLPD